MTERNFSDLIAKILDLIKILLKNSGRRKCVKLGSYVLRIRKCVKCAIDLLISILKIS